jgi:tRNA 5-methylaminomethyl-2-thiouridine biosynthesis bifunctional protein
VIGAGLAGCATGHELARRGWAVTLLERRAGPAAEASGNPAGVVMPRPEAQASPAGGFYLHAWLHGLRLLERYAEAADWRPEGVLQLAVNERRTERYPRFIEAYGLPDALVRWLSEDETASAAGIGLGFPALYYPGSGWLAPAGLCRVLIDRPGVTLRTGIEVAAIERSADGWRALDAAGGMVAEAPVLVLANAASARCFLPWLPLIPARGQLSRIDADPTSARLRTVLYGKGYVIPARDGRHLIGASLVSGDADPDLRPAEDTANLKRLESLLPKLSRTRAGTLCGAFAAVRATTPDRLPLVGAVPDVSAFRNDPGRPERGRRRVELPRSVPGLYLLSGLGTRGITIAPLAAELLASLIDGEPPSLARDLVAAVDPARFLLRERKRDGRS